MLVGGKGGVNPTITKAIKKLKNTPQKQRLSYLSIMFGGIKPRISFGSTTSIYEGR
jgi:hypothetical protein